MPTKEQSERTTTLRGTSFKLAGPELHAGETAPNFDLIDSSLQNFNLEKTGRGVRIFSVVPSLDTPVCDAQTRRFDELASQQPEIRVFTVSMDLPFAQKRWCGNFGIDNVGMLSDHRTGSFGEQYGTLIPDLRIESRAIFVLDPEDKIKYVEYVKEVGDHPDYDAAVSAARAALGEKSASQQA